MIVAALYAQQYHPDEVQSAKEEALRKLQQAQSVLQSTSAGLLFHARRCTTMSAVDSNDDVSTSSCTTPASQVTYSSTLDETVRQEWIDAAFGKDFYASSPHTPPPRQGVGEAGIESYVTFSATIPPMEPNVKNDTQQKHQEVVDQEEGKVGITLARIALGLYVHSVEPGTEAHCAGIQVGSILVEVNGIGMLGEPSRQALERLWQYEGLFDDANNNNVTNKTKDNNSKTHTEPMSFKFIRNGKLYNTMLFSKPPYGISWAPCGNFALVQKVYSRAAAAGARRGCLVVAVNNTSIRQGMDHHVAATTIRQLFMDNQADINLTFGFTPAASRSGFFERALADGASTKKGSPSETKRNLASTADGVHVRSHPLEYGNLWNCGGIHTTTNTTVTDEQTQLMQLSISELAGKVAAGEMVAPTGFENGKRCTPQLLPPTLMPATAIRRPKQFIKCPQLKKEAVLTNWDSIDALVYCMQVHQARYDEDEIGSVVARTSNLTRLDALRSLMQDEHSWRMANQFLLQWVSLLCTADENECDEEASTGSAATATFSMELANMLLRMSRSNDDFCQRLHFVLRSFTATLEGQRKHDDNNTRSLLTLLQALDRLRTAQKQLASQLTKDTPLVRISSEQLESSPSEDDNSGLAVTASTSSVSSGPVSVVVPKKKNRFKIFRKSKKGVAEKTTSSLSRHKVHQSTGDLVTPIGSISPVSSPSKTTLENKRTNSLTNLSMQLEYMSVPLLLENMNMFLTELNGICDTIEGSLLRSISQKIADWALQPWNASKDMELARVTEGMRAGLSNIDTKPLVNPIEPMEVLVSVDPEQCYILPSAHFPLLLTFNVDSQKKPGAPSSVDATPKYSFLKDEKIYRTKVEIVAVRGSSSGSVNVSSSTQDGRSYVVHAAVSGTVLESEPSVPTNGNTKILQSWNDGGGLLTFDTRSSWGPPETLSLEVSTVNRDRKEQVARTDSKGQLQYASDVGYCWVNMKSLWDRVGDATLSDSKSVTCHAQLWSPESSNAFDLQGDIPNGLAPVADRLELELKVTTSVVKFDGDGEQLQRKRQLLYKHDDDLRQEMFAIQFINTCGMLLNAAGLDLKLLTFRCIPVGDSRGFIEWIPGSVPLSDICQFTGSILATRTMSGDTDYHRKSEDSSLSGVAKAGLSKYQSIHQPNKSPRGSEKGTTVANNPIQDFFRSVAYDQNAPYYIQRQVMDNYIKSCAGYSVLTYLLGVGDRHLDNLLLHQNGYFFHCDYSFILGNDPKKKFLPMRITEDMIYGMGGPDSDNYAMFLSLAGAAFITLRRPQNVRVILSIVRLMVPACLPDISVNQSPDVVLSEVRDRLRLDLCDDEAISFMERLIEDSVSSKFWLAVDAMHNIGKRF